MAKKIFLLGSSGSIGVNTLNCLRYLNENKKSKSFKIMGLAAGSDHQQLEKQIAEFSPKVAYIQSPKGYDYLKNKFPKLKLYSGKTGILEAMEQVSFDMCVNALVGSVGLLPTLKAVEKGADIALANKETLIMAGDIVKKTIDKKKVKLIPIDSEHAAIYQLLKGIKKSELEKLIITASGGPFFFKNIKNPSIEETLNHPTWKMGKKITVDSATMMNKGLEIIEAHYLFDVPFDKIDTIVHPQSIIHSMVETIDGEIYAQIGYNDMRHPIQNAITNPSLVKNPLKKCRLWELPELTFFKHDFKKFPMLNLAYECGEQKGTALAAMNAANEGAVDLFLQGKISYKDIYKRVKREVDRHPFRKQPSVDYILKLDDNIKERLKKEKARF